MTTLLVPAPAEANEEPAYLPVAASKAPPLMVPKSKVMVPAPMAAVELAWPVVASFCACASLLTSSE